MLFTTNEVCAKKVKQLHGTQYLLPCTLRQNFS
jgi:hypothetical protein